MRQSGRGGDAGGTLLTTINALDPIYFTFDGSEALFLKAKRARPRAIPSRPVEVRLQDETDYRWKGQLDFTDNGLDPRSGTIRGRAVLANPGDVPDPRHVRQHAAVGGGRGRRCWSPTRRCQTDQARKIV
jgi:multidrug efflux system membrane fusion protein